MEIKHGATNQTVYFHLVDATTGLAKLGLVFDSAGAVASYNRNRGARVAIALATLASATAAHADGGFILVDDANMKGLYRLDLPDAAVVTGSPLANITLEFDGVKEETLAIDLVANTKADLKTDLTTLLTRLPSALTISGGIVSADVKKWLAGTPNALASGRVDSSVGNMLANVLTAAAIATDAITAAKIAANALTAAKFAANFLTAGKIATDAIGAAQLAVDAVNKIRDSILSDATKFAGASLTEARLSELDTTAGKMADQVDKVKTETDKIALVDAGAGATGSVIEETENRATPADVKAQADLALTDYDSSAGVAKENSVLSIQNNTRFVASVPAWVLIPTSAENVFKLTALFYDTAGNMEDPDVVDGAAQIGLDLDLADGTDKNALLFDDFALTTAATASTTFTGHVKMVRDAVGRFSLFMKIPSTESPDQLTLNYRLQEASIDLFYSRNTVSVDVEPGTVTLVDSAANKTIIAQAMKSEDVSATGLVSGSIQKVTNDNIDANETKLDTVDTVVDAIKSKTDTLPADPASETNVNANETKIDTIDTVVDAIKLKTDPLPTDPASETNVNANETKIDTIDTIVDAMKLKTDKLTFNSSNGIVGDPRNGKVRIKVEGLVERSGPTSENIKHRTTPTDLPNYLALFTSQTTNDKDFFNINHLVGKSVILDDGSNEDAECLIVGGYFFDTSSNLTNRPFGIAKETEFGITEGGSTIINDNWEAEDGSTVLDEDPHSSGWTFICVRANTGVGTSGDNLSLFANSALIDQSKFDNITGSGDWTATERENFRQALGIDGTKTAGGTAGDLQNVKTKTDTLPSDPASETNVDANETKIDLLQVDTTALLSGQTSILASVAALNDVSAADVWNVVSTTVVAAGSQGEKIQLLFAALAGHFKIFNDALDSNRLKMTFFDYAGTSVLKTVEFKRPDGAPIAQLMKTNAVAERPV